ncbi:uncharacterized protein LOC124287684 [Haliotis rubra]|uniref:uncharacterized protein LOC124287684 n=1 Tax=Haliotis rubra TaxID=36100 RepID=UPI001EE5554C|nr:uncharacterized protein LOC124287684 [Haliotis rubra]
MSDSRNNVTHTYTCAHAVDDDVMVRNDVTDGGGVRLSPTHCSRYVSFSSTQHHTMSGDTTSLAPPVGTMSSPDSSHLHSYGPSSRSGTQKPNILRKTSRRREVSTSSHGNSANPTPSLKEKRLSKGCPNKRLKKAVSNICGQQRQSVTGSVCADNLVNSLTEACSLPVVNKHVSDFPQDINNSIGTVLPFYHLDKHHHRYNGSVSLEAETPSQPAMSSVFTLKPHTTRPMNTSKSLVKASPTEHSVLPPATASPSTKGPTQLKGNTYLERVKGNTMLSRCLPVQICHTISIQRSATSKGTGDTGVEDDKDTSGAGLQSPQSLKTLRTMTDRRVSSLPDNVIKSEPNISQACDATPVDLKESNNGRSVLSQNQDNGSEVNSVCHFGQRGSKRGRPKPKTTKDTVNAAPQPSPSPQISKSAATHSNKTDPSTTCILPTDGSIPFDPTAYALCNTGRSPFGFYHNDKLYLYVPDPETGDGQSTIKEGVQKGLVAIQPKSVKSPLSLQADQLMGTSEKLVNRIKDSSDTIPIVIMRPKRKAEVPPRNEAQRGKGTVAGATIHRQKTGCYSSSTKSEENTGRKSSTSHSVKDNATKSARSAESVNGHGFSDIICSISRMHAQRKDNTKATSSQGVQMKDCYIDMGTRKSLPDTLDLQTQHDTTSCKELNKGHNSSSQVTKVHIKPTCLPKSKVKVTSSEKSPKSGKGGKLMIKQEPDQLQGKIDDNRMASLISQYHNRGNKQSEDGMKQPFKVILQTPKAVVVPNECPRKINSPKQLVELECTEAPYNIKDFSLTKVHQCTGSTGISVIRRKLTKTSGCISDHSQTNTHRDNKLLKSSGEKSNNMTGRNLRAAEPNMYYSNGRLNTKSKINSNPITTGLGSIGLQRNVKLESKTTSNTLGCWFQDIGQLFYAAGAQINVTDPFTTSQRTTIFTICFTTQDSFLKIEHDVPSSLPAYLSYSDDHVVTTIFTGHMCSGFFLVTPTGMVKDDPKRPHLYTESALLEPYSSKHPLPAHSVCLVLGPLEEDWKISLQLANSLPKRTSVDKLVEHFIGEEDCRCLSTSHSMEQIGISDSYKRRPLSSVQYKKHRDHIEVLSCKCRECNPLSRWRRGKKAISAPPLSSGDEDSLLNTTGDEDKGFLNTSQPHVKEAGLLDDGFNRPGCWDPYLPVKTEYLGETFSMVSPVRLGCTTNHANIKQMKMVEATLKQTAGGQQIEVVNSVVIPNRKPKQKEGKMVVKMGFPCRRTCDHPVRQ